MRLFSLKQEGKLCFPPNFLIFVPPSEDFCDIFSSPGVPLDAAAECRDVIGSLYALQFLIHSTFTLVDWELNGYHRIVHIVQY